MAKDYVQNAAAYHRLFSEKQRKNRAGGFQTNVQEGREECF